MPTPAGAGRSSHAGLQQGPTLPQPGALVDKVLYRAGAGLRADRLAVVDTGRPLPTRRRSCGR